MSIRRRSAAPVSPLASTELEVTIIDLFAEYTVRHHFRNDGLESIEAVFSFPVPLDAAFLGMRATLAGESLVAQIQPQRQAAHAYDDAIAEGDSAVLLRCPEPGVLSLSLGNLKPGETGEIELRFAAELRVADRSARFSLPLVHRPRYGNWRLEELEAPTHDFAVEHPMSARIRVIGLLASAPVACNTHAARFARQGEEMELAIPEAMLDRDLVLTFELSQDMSPTVHLVEDGDACLGVINFVLPAGDEPSHPLDLCLVLDGSGSMEGDAVVQSRHAALAIADALGDGDRIQVLRFGSTVVPMFRRPLVVTHRVRAALRELVPTIDAELGGTDMDTALQRALDGLMGGDDDRLRAIVLVTDGAVQPDDVAKSLERARKEGVRLFVVAVGSSAAAEVLAPLATGSGGVLERAVPAEPIETCVMRQFRRARFASPVLPRVRWPGTVIHLLPGDNVYPGDAVSLAAALGSGADGEVRVSSQQPEFAASAPLPVCAANPALRAILGHRRYLMASSETTASREKIALHYGLLTGETSAVLVKLRNAADKADGLPQIVRVPQMLPDGMLGAAFLRHGAVSHLTGVVQAACVQYNSLRLVDRCASEPIVASRSPRKEDEERLEEWSETDVALDAEKVKALFLRLFQVLRSTMLDHSGRLPTLAATIKLLPPQDGEEICRLLLAAKIKLSDSKTSLRLLVALEDFFGSQNYSDEEEAALAVALSDKGLSLGGNSPDLRDVELSETIARLASEGINTTIRGKTRGTFFCRFLSRVTQD